MGPRRQCGPPARARKPSYFKARVLPRLSGQWRRAVVPPLVVLALLLWSGRSLCSRPEGDAAGPTKIWQEANDLIVDPFFVAGPQDIGLGWRVLTSLQRVPSATGSPA